MNVLQRMTIGAIALVAVTTAAVAQSTALMVSGSGFGSRGVILFDPHDGSPLTGTYYFEVTESSAVLKHPMQVGEEIWISAQSGATGHRILRYDLTGNFLGEITEAAPGQPLNNIRGMALVGQTVYLTNSGSTGGAPGPALVAYDMNGNWQATYSTAGAATSPFSALWYNGELIVGNSDSTDLQRFDLAGNYLGPFHVGVIAFIQQIIELSNGNLMATGWSSNGLHEFDAAGNEVSVIGANSPRGVWELGNGNIMWAGGSGVHVYDVTTQMTTQVLDGLNGQYIDLLTFDDPTPPCPGDLTGSGSVGVPDLLALLACWGPVEPGSDCEDADLTGSGAVGVPDLLELLSNWGPCPE